MVAERARFASFIHDVNLLAALEIRLVLVHGARPQIEAELRRKGLQSRYAQGLRVTDEAGAHRGQARRRRAARGDRGAALARPAELADGARADPRGVRQLHHRAADRRAQGRRLPVHRRGAQGRRRRARRRSSTSPTSCWCRSSATRRPAKCSTSRGRTSPRASPWRCKRRQAAHVHRQAADQPQGRGGLGAHRRRGRGARRQEGQPHAGTTRGARAPGARGGKRRDARPPGDAPLARLAAARALHACRRRHHGHRRRGGEAAPGEDRGRARHARADRAARSRRHAGEAQPRAARSRDRQLPRDRARRAHRRLRGALSLSPTTRAPNSPASRSRRASRRRPRRAAAQGVRGAREEPQAAHACSRSPRTRRTGSSSRDSAPPTSMRCPSSARRSTTGAAARRSSSSEYNFAHGTNREVRQARRAKPKASISLPIPGELGKRIWENVSKEAWAQWLKQQTMLVNENRLNLADQKRAQVPHGADRAPLLRRRRRYRLGLRPAAARQEIAERRAPARRVPSAAHTNTGVTPAASSTRAASHTPARLTEEQERREQRDRRAALLGRRPA